MHAPGAYRPVDPPTLRVLRLAAHPSVGELPPDIQAALLAEARKEILALERLLGG